MADEIERIYVIPLKKQNYNRSRAADTAVKRVKNFLKKHMKVEDKDIWIDESLNHALWSRGKYKMPGKIRVKAVKFEDGVVEASLPELAFEKSRREILREEREKKTPILRREEMPEGGEGVDGAEDYDIAPTADGDVKIKKKKSSKEKTEEEEKEEKSKKAKKTEKKDTSKKGESKKQKKDKKESSKSKRESGKQKKSKASKTSKKTKSSKSKTKDKKSKTDKSGKDKKK